MLEENATAQGGNRPHVRRDPLERPARDAPWMMIAALPEIWTCYLFNGDASALEDEDDWNAEKAEIAEKSFSDDGYTVTGFTYAPHGTWEPTNEYEEAFDSSE